MAMVAAGIANRGMVMQPYLTDELQSPVAGAAGARAQSEELRQAVSATTRHRGHQADGRDGAATARRQPAAIPGVQVAGKTGTAQSGRTNPDGTEVPPYAWFVVVRAGRRRPRSRSR